MEKLAKEIGMAAVYLTAGAGVIACLAALLSYLTSY